MIWWNSRPSLKQLFPCNIKTICFFTTVYHGWCLEHEWKKQTESKFCICVKTLKTLLKRKIDGPHVFSRTSYDHIWTPHGECEIKKSMESDVLNFRECSAMFSYILKAPFINHTWNAILIEKPITIEMKSNYNLITMKSQINKRY